MKPFIKIEIAEGSLIEKWLLSGMLVSVHLFQKTQAYETRFL